VAKTACLNLAIAVYEELIMKEGNSFVITNLLDAKMGIEVLLQEMQRRPLEPGEEVERRQQYSRFRYLTTTQRTFIDLLDLLIGKPVEIVEHK
jgi:hypothetical protein